MDSRLLKLIWILLFFMIVLPVHGASGHTYEEWEKILDIGDDRDLLTGAKLTLDISPPLYYHEEGSEISLDGTFAGVFGPIRTIPIVVTQWNSTGPIRKQECITDDSGSFNLTGVLLDEGINQFQAHFSADVTSLETSVTSEKKEISCILAYERNISVWNEMGGNLSESNVSCNKGSDNQTYQIFLSVLSSEFIPGDQVILSGYVSNERKKRVPYSRVLLHFRGMNQDNHYEEIIEGFTNATGDITFHFAMSGPYPVSCILEFPDTGMNMSVWSPEVQLVPLSMGINPPAKNISDDEYIDLFLDQGTLFSSQIIPLYGWYGGYGGKNSSFQVLEPVWYNFGEKIWDSYQNSSNILTNIDGKFECTLIAPETPGMYLLSVRKPGDTTHHSLYSNVQAIQVSTPVKPDESIPDPTPDLFVSAEKQFIQLSEGLNLSFLLQYPDGTPVPDYPVQLFDSENGVEWIPIQQNVSSTDPDGMAFLQVWPEKAGYHYYQAIAGENPEDLIQSNTLVVPVLSF